MFAVGIVLMFCSSMGLLGLLRKSWKILGLLVVVLIALLFTLFGIMTVCFVLGYQMPSLRDIVQEGWQKGCDDPAENEVGCMQVELVANNWCWDHAGLPIPNIGGEGNMFEKGETDPNCALDPSTNLATDGVIQRTHVCSISCQKAIVATLEDNMGWVAIGCYCAFFALVIVVIWNSQTHHGLWCISPSSNEDDDENTVMAIPPVMAVIAYLLNGVLGLAGLGLAIAAGAMLSSPTSFTAAFAIFLGGTYFVVAAISCGAVAKNLHWLLRFCNIAYFATCIPLLILSLVAAVYSGKIENIYDFYDDNWCKLRGEIDAVDPLYCKIGNTLMSDAACKNKIVSDTSDNLVIVGYVIFGSLGAVACLIWFSMRLARKFKFDARGDFDDAAGEDYGDEVEDYGDEVDDKGGDDSEDPTSDGAEDDGKADPIQMGLLAAPCVITLIALAMVFGLGSDGPQVSVDCSRSFVVSKFNGTGLLGEVRFSQWREEDGVVVDVAYVADEDMWSQPSLQASVTQYEIHEFPVPEDGSCDGVGAVYPTPTQGIYTPLVGAPAMTSPANSVEMLTGNVELEELYYDGITPDPIRVGGAGSLPAVQLFGETAITGRSVVLKGPGTCLQADKSLDAALADQAGCEAVAGNTWVPPEVACATISNAGKFLSANFTDASGYWDGKVRGTFTFSQVTTRGSESDMVIYVELEATDAWDQASTADGAGVDNGCTGTDVANFVSCGHKAHVHHTGLGSSQIAAARPPAGASDIDVHAGAVCSSASGHFNLVDGVDGPCVDTSVTDPQRGTTDCSIECPLATTYADRMAKCETGDLTGMYGLLNIGAPGKPAKNVWVNKYDRTHSLMLGSLDASGGNVMAGRSVVIHRRAGDTAPTKADGSAITGSDRVACANIPNLALDPWASNGR